MPQMMRYNQHCMSYSIKALKAASGRQRSVSPSRAFKFISILKIRIKLKIQALKARLQIKRFFCPTAISKIQLDPEIKNLLSSALHW